MPINRIKKLSRTLIKVDVDGYNERLEVENTQCTRMLLAFNLSLTAISCRAIIVHFACISATSPSVGHHALRFFIRFVFLGFLIGCTFGYCVPWYIYVVPVMLRNMIRHRTVDSACIALEIKIRHEY